MSSLRINAAFLEMEWAPRDEDRIAAWEMYVELLTRITTQNLHPEHGDEATALLSIYSLFATTRDVLKRNGRHCSEFTKIAIVILNQKIRPFTAKWHKISVSGAFKNEKKCKAFRKELAELQKTLRAYTQMLADMAGVEDLTGLQSM